MDNLQILMPAHNEEKSIEQQISKVHKILKKKIKFSFLICEDGSSDKTLEILKILKKKYKIEIISKEIKQGYSKAVMSGMKKAKAKYLLIMDSDGQCDPREILKFWNRRNESDIICGWRIMRKDFLYRKFFSDLARYVYMFFFKVRLKDPSFAFTLIKKKFIKTYQIFHHLCPMDFFGNLMQGLFIKVLK